MAAAQRQLLIGVDAMEWTLVERWAAAGMLPIPTAPRYGAARTSAGTRRLPPGHRMDDALVRRQPGQARDCPQDRRAGSHTPSSFLAACGPGIPAGAEVAGHSTVDVAPTLLRQAGVQIPDTMDGVPITLGG